MVMVKCNLHVPVLWFYFQLKFVLALFSQGDFNGTATSYDNTNGTEINAELVYRSYTITCCGNGKPMADGDIAKHILEWSEEHVGATGQNNSCNRYTGYYNLPLNVFVNNRRGGVGVRCQCPEQRDHLDRNCRYVPPCQNSGYRSFSINLRCVCPPGWFGELCEKFCYSGEIVKVKGFDTCKCRQHFYGDECNNVHCFNGGTPVGGHGCVCQLPYLGQHCEVKLNGTLHYSHHQDTFLTRDISGSIISLLLVVGLSFLVYLMIRRKTQMLTRRRIAFRNFAGLRRIDENGQTAPTQLNMTNLQLANLAGPPPYSVAPVGATCILPVTENSGRMPPLPSYDDALKLPSNGGILSGNNSRNASPVPRVSEETSNTSNLAAESSLTENRNDVTENARREDLAAESLLTENRNGENGEKNGVTENTRREENTETVESVPNVTIYANSDSTNGTGGGNVAVENSVLNENANNGERLYQA